ncbi:MAG: hydrogenase maturation protease [Verrucomicrobiae bacterium]|nr:hydrogenase maturation protease [Verrucomicrobiae bacterium]
MEKSLKPSSGKFDTSNICVLGIGNPDCGDDAAGPAVIQALKEMMSPKYQLQTQNGETSELIETLGHFDAVIIIDAIAARSEAGRIHRFNASKMELPAIWFSKYSTHSMGVHEAIEMARVLGDLPARTLVFGIEGTHFEPGEDMSPEVEDKISELAYMVKREIDYLISKPINPG